MLIVTSSALQAKSLAPIEVSDDNLLVVELSYEQLLLEESVFAFHTPEYTLIPLQILIDSLDFPLSIDVDARTVDGWFRRESNTFSLDIENQTLYIRGEKQIWPDNFRYADDGFDIYFDIDTIEQWFEIELHLNVSQLSLTMHSEDPLPIIEQKKREEKRKKLKKQEKEQTPSNYIKNTYDWIASPTIDIEHSLSIDRLKQPEDSDHPNDRYISHYQSTSIQGSMDALKHSLRFSYTRQEEEDFRLTLSRSARDPGSSLWPGVDHYALGDLTSHSDSILFKPSTGIGAYISYGSKRIQEQNSLLLLEGDAPPGWEVELYRNGSLIDFTNAGNSGKFEFTEIETYVGENIFDIRIYGPQGQYRELQKRIHISDRMLPKGDWSYQAYAIDKNKRLLGSGHRQSTENETENAEPLTELNEENDSKFLLADTYFGVNDSVTAGITIAQFTPESQSEPLNYVGLSTYSSFLGGFTQLKSVVNNDSGSAHSIILKNRWNDLNYNLEYNKFNHLITEHNADDVLHSDASISMNGFLQEIIPLGVSYDLRFAHESYRNNYELWRASNRLSTRVWQTTLAHSVEFTHSKVNETPSTVDATLALTRRFFAWRTKFEANYGAYPNFKLNTLSTTASYRSKNKMSYIASLSYTNSTSNIVGFENTFSWSFKPLSLSLSFGLDNEDTQFVSLGLSTSLGYDQTRNSITLDSAGSSNNASALIRAFVDENNNGQYDDNEAPLSEVIFKGRNHWKSRPTNEEGLTLLSGIPNLKLQAITLNNRSIEDPFLQAKDETKYIYTHAGKQNYIEFALLPTLEVEGEIAYLFEGAETAVSGVPLILEDIETKKQYRSISEYDGVFIFDGVLPGIYELSVVSRPKFRDKYILPPPTTIHVTGSDGVIYASQVKLLPKLELEK